MRYRMIDIYLIEIQDEPIRHNRTVILVPSRLHVDALKKTEKEILIHKIQGCMVLSKQMKLHNKAAYLW